MITQGEDVEIHALKKQGVDQFDVIEPYERQRLKEDRHLRAAVR